MYTVEYYVGRTWLRVTRDGKVIHEGDCRLSAWAVADILAPLGHSVEVRPALGGSWPECETGITTVPPIVRFEYKHELASVTTTVTQP